MKKQLICTVYMLPFSPYDMDNHVVTHVYIKELKKWIILDPTFNCYGMDENKRPLDLIEMRGLLANRKQIYFNVGINYNGDTMLEYGENKIGVEAYYTEYLAKNLFYFLTCRKSCYGIDEAAKAAVCVVLPKGYDMKKSKLSKLEYLISECKDKETLANLTEQYDKMKSGKTPFKHRHLICPQAFLAIN